MKRTTGTSGKNAIRGFGGFNRSEYNIQHHKPGAPANTYTEQDHRHKPFAGINPLNNPRSTTKKVGYGANTDFAWREQTLHGAVPGQVAGGFGRLPFSSADTSQLQWKLKHGFVSQDPSLRGMINETDIAPKLRADWQWTPDPYLHTDIGVPSVVRQGVDFGTVNQFPVEKRKIQRGKHDHVNMRLHTHIQTNYDSNTASGTHHTSGQPPSHVTAGLVATRAPLERPLMLSDLPQPPQPMTIR